MEEQWDFYFQYGTWHKPNRNIKIPAKDLRDKSKGFFWCRISHVLPPVTVMDQGYHKSVRKIKSKLKMLKFKY